MTAHPLHRRMAVLSIAVLTALSACSASDPGAAAPQSTPATAASSNPSAVSSAPPVATVDTPAPSSVASSSVAAPAPNSPIPSPVESVPAMSAPADASTAEAVKPPASQPQSPAKPTTAAPSSAAPAPASDRKTGYTDLPKTYREAYQVGREKNMALAPATGKDAHELIAGRCKALVPAVEAKQDWIDGCFAGAVDAANDGTSQSTYPWSYQNAREHYDEIVARGDIDQSCRYEAHLTEVQDDLDVFLAGCADGVDHAARLAVPSQERMHAPDVPANDAKADPGDLGVSVPISKPRCDGSYAVFVGSAVTPGSYQADVQRFLTANPGSKYLRTSWTCDSLNPDSNGNPIYGVYLGPFKDRAQACKTSAATTGSTVKKLAEGQGRLPDETC